MVVPKDGVGGLLGVAEQLDVEAVAPKLWRCCVVRKTGLTVQLLKGLTSSSSLERHMSASPIAITTSLSVCVDGLVFRA
jgi:hypothetical protein